MIISFSTVKRLTKAATCRSLKTKQFQYFCGVCLLAAAYNTYKEINVCPSVARPREGGSVGKLQYSAASKQSNSRKRTSSLVSFTDERMEHQRGYKGLLITAASRQRHKPSGAIPIL